MGDIVVSEEEYENLKACIKGILSLPGVVISHI